MKRAQNAFILIFAALFLTAGCTCAKQQDEIDDEIGQELSLNTLVTNDMSSSPLLGKMDKTVSRYMRKWDLKGLQIVMMRNDSLVFAKGYGKADEGVEMTPGHIMRIASVSKLITAAGIMKLVEQGKLSLESRAFGPEGILSEFETSSRLYQEITIEHLLRHEGGFSRDPMFLPLDNMKLLGLDRTPTNDELIAYTLKRRLRFRPGKDAYYSNFGYVVLSKIIEKVSGLTYEEFIRKEVLVPAKCYDFHICENYYAGNLSNQARQYVHEGEGKFIEDFTGNGQMVERCYGGNNITALQGAGAWVASALEVARFVASIDGKPGVEDILSKESVEAMVSSEGDHSFALGWNTVSPSVGWTRTGSLAGTTAYIKYYPDGECWILLSNSSTYRGPRQIRYHNSFLKTLRDSYSDKMPSQDLFKLLKQ